MLLPDVNVLVRAFRQDLEAHAVHRAFVQGLLDGDEAFGLSSLVLSGFLRVVTHPRVFAQPDPIDEALAFTEVLRGSERRIAGKEARLEKTERDLVAHPDPQRGGELASQGDPVGKDASPRGVGEAEEVLVHAEHVNPVDLP